MAHCDCGTELFPRKYQARGSIGVKTPTYGYEWEIYVCPEEKGWHIRRVHVRVSVALTEPEVDQIIRALVYLEGVEPSSADLRNRLKEVYGDHGGEAT